MASMITYEDNVTCIAQLKEEYIKEERTKHILPKLFFTCDLQKNGDINVLQVRPHENLEDFLTKSLQRKTFEQLTHKIGFCRLKDDYLHVGRNKYCECMNT